MSRYTTELRYICENYAEYTKSQGFNSIDDIITKAAPLVFSFTFPIFDESYRLPLEVKILRHYYTREICDETVGLWKLRLCDKLNMIMPYYNQLYTSATLIESPFTDVDVTRTYTTTGKVSTDGNIKTDTTTNAKNTDVFSNTPQGGLEDVESGRYLTTARLLTSNDTTGGSSTENRDVITDESRTEHVTGKQGSQSYSIMLSEYRKTMLNIDKMVIDELEELFFMLWE